MNKKILAVLNVIFLVFLNYSYNFVTGKLYGEPCNSSISNFCSSDVFDLNDLICVNDKCRCKYEDKAKHVKNGEIYCETFFSQSCDCSVDQKCVKVEQSRLASCVCKDDLQIKSDGKCYKSERISPMNATKCGFMNDTVNMCDEMQFSFCETSKCVCYKDYYYNFTTEKCSLKTDSPIYKKYGYKGMPGEYCLNQSDCVYGLKCSENVCICPSPCVYNKKRIACDCGDASYDTPSAVIWTGVIFTIISMFFWCYCDVRTYQKFKRDRSDRVSTARGDTQFTPSSPKVTNNTPLNDLPPSYSSVQRSDLPDENPPPAYSEKNSAELPYPLQSNSSQNEERNFGQSSSPEHPVGFSEPKNLPYGLKPGTNVTPTAPSFNNN